MAQTGNTEQEEAANNLSRAFLLLAFLVWTLTGCGKESVHTEKNPFVAELRPLPTSPSWVAEVTKIPDWWPEIAVNYTEGMAHSNKWAQLTNMEGTIKGMVWKGTSPVKERRELIKYLSLWSESPSLRGNDFELLSIEIAETYEALGDYRRSAAKYAKLAVNDSLDSILRLLAIQYERVGDKEYALSVYKYMSKAFTTNSFGLDFAIIGIAGLTTITNDWNPQKPVWWKEYENPPTWLDDVPTSLPQFSCFADGYSFVVHNIWPDKNPQELLKAWTLLATFKPLTFLDKINLIQSMGRAYSEAGDHHRAIETEWTIVERLPRGHIFTVESLKFIASEFEKLGETNKAAEFWALLPPGQNKTEHPDK